MIKQFEGLGNLEILLMHDNRLRRTHDYLFADQRLAKVLKLVDKPGEPALLLYQLDWDADCVNELEDYRVSSSTYLQDGFTFKSSERVMRRRFGSIRGLGRRFGAPGGRLSRDGRADGPQALEQTFP